MGIRYVTTYPYLLSKTCLYTCENVAVLDDPVHSPQQSTLSTANSDCFPIVTPVCQSTCFILVQFRGLDCSVHDITICKQSHSAQSWVSLMWTTHNTQPSLLNIKVVQIMSDIFGQIATFGQQLQCGFYRNHLNYKEGDYFSCATSLTL